jgi:hypothetical protein
MKKASKISLKSNIPSEFDQESAVLLWRNLLKFYSSYSLKILRALKANSSPPPEFDTDEERSYYIVTIKSHVGFDYDPIHDLVNAQISVSDLVNDPVNDLTNASDLVNDPVNNPINASDLVIDPLNENDPVNDLLSNTQKKLYIKLKTSGNSTSMILHFWNLYLPLK